MNKPSCCSQLSLLLFSLLGLWFLLQPFGVPVYGTFWSWVIILTGILFMSMSKTHCRCTSALVGLAIFAFGIRYLLADLHIIRACVINPLYLMTFLIPLGLSLSCSNPQEYCGK